MNKFRTILLLAVFSIVFYACKKEPSAEVDENNKTCLMSKQFAKDDTTTYDYDNLGRVIKRNWMGVGTGSNVKLTQTFDYLYTLNQIISKGKTNYGEEFADTLNVKDGLVVDAINIVSQQLTGSSEKTRSHRFFSYNNEGYVTKDSTIRVISDSNYMKSDTTITIVNYIYKDGNVTNLSAVFSSLRNNTLKVVFTDTIEYTYYTDKLNTINNKTDFIFKPTKNLVKRIATSTKINGSIGNSNYNFSYEFDKNGMVSRRIEKYGSGDVRSDVAYEYLCK